MVTQIPYQLHIPGQPERPTVHVRSLKRAEKVCLDSANANEIRGGIYKELHLVIVNLTIQYY